MNLSHCGNFLKNIQPREEYLWGLCNFSKITSLANNQFQAYFLCDQNKHLDHELNNTRDNMMTMQREMDHQIYRLNEGDALMHSQKEEISNLTQVIEDYERRLVRERNENEKANRSLELMTKSKEQKERHMAVLVKEKEKVLRQMDQLVLAQQKDPKAIVRPQTAKMTFATPAFKENQSIMSNMSVIGIPLGPNESEVQVANSGPRIRFREEGVPHLIQQQIKNMNESRQITRLEPWRNKYNFDYRNMARKKSQGREDFTRFKPIQIQGPPQQRSPFPRASLFQIPIALRSHLYFHVISEQQFAGADPSDSKRELGILKREVKRLGEVLIEKEKEVERLKKENFNLVNRCRNTLASGAASKK